MGKTSIEWTSYSWNPLRGTKGRHHCTKVSDGCKSCYAERMNIRFGGPAYTVGADTIRLDEKVLTEPLRWRKPRMVFVCSMTDLFHESIPVQTLYRVFEMMKRSNRLREVQGVPGRHTFQVLTKRPDRALEFYRKLIIFQHDPNVWLGVFCENQEMADKRIPILLQIPAAVRWASFEPLLGPIVIPRCERDNDNDGNCDKHPLGCPKIDWAVVGGESGPGARPMHPDWARSLRDQCNAAGVPFFFKQWGEYAYTRIEDDSRFACGAAYNDPRGGRTAAVIRMRSTKAFTHGKIRRLEAGDETGLGVMISDEVYALRVGKKLAGRTLDGRTWEEMPK